MTQQQTELEKAMKEFDEKFDLDGEGFLCLKNECECDSMLNIVKNFISNLLATQKKEMVENIIKEVGYLQAEHANTVRHGDTPDDAYNRVIDLLKQL
jgi:hypothetical protein